MIARRTQAIMDRLDGLLGNRSGSRNRGAHSGEANRETRVNFNEQPMDPREEGATHPVMPPGIIGRWVQRIPEEVLLAADRPRANVLCETRMRLGEVIPQAGATRIKEDLSPAIRTEGKRIITIKRDIHVMQRQLPQRLNT